MDLQRIQKRMNYLEDRLKTVETTPSVASPPPPPMSVEKESELKVQILALKDKVDTLEQTVAGLLDRIISLKEKIQPAVDVTALETRIVSLEEVTSSLVGMGRS